MTTEANTQKMSSITEYLKSELPGYGFALLTFKIENGTTCGDYLSNVKDEFMISALELQLDALKKRRTVSTPTI